MLGVISSLKKHKWDQVIENGKWEVSQKDLFELTFAEIYLTKRMSTTCNFSLEWSSFNQNQSKVINGVAFIQLSLCYGLGI